MTTKISFICCTLTCTNGWWINSFSSSSAFLLSIKFISQNPPTNRSATPHILGEGENKKPARQDPLGHISVGSCFYFLKNNNSYKTPSKKRDSRQLQSLSLDAFLFLIIKFIPAELHLEKGGTALLTITFSWNIMNFLNKTIVPSETFPAKQNKHLWINHTIWDRMESRETFCLLCPTGKITYNHLTENKYDHEWS